MSDLAQLQGTGEFDQEASPDVEIIAARLMERGKKFDPFNGENISMAVGAAPKEQMIEASSWLPRNDEIGDMHFCRIVLSISNDYCKRLAYEHASRTLA